MFFALENNNQNNGGSYIEKVHSVLFIRSERLNGSIADIQNVLIKLTTEVNSMDGKAILYAQIVTKGTYSLLVQLKKNKKNNII